MRPQILERERAYLAQKWGERRSSYGWEGEGVNKMPKMRPKSDFIYAKSDLEGIKGWDVFTYASNG